MRPTWKKILGAALILSASMLMQPVRFVEAFDNAQFVVLAPADEDPVCKAGQPCPQASFIVECVTDNRSTANDAAVYFRYNGIPSAHVVPGRAANAQQDAGILGAFKVPPDCASYTPAP